MPTPSLESGCVSPESTWGPCGQVKCVCWVAPCARPSSPMLPTPGLTWRLGPWLGCGFSLVPGLALAVLDTLRVPQFAGMGQFAPWVLGSLKLRSSCGRGWGCSSPCWASLGLPHRPQL